MTSIASTVLVHRATGHMYLIDVDHEPCPDWWVQDEYVVTLLGKTDSTWFGIDVTRKPSLATAQDLAQSLIDYFTDPDEGMRW